MTYKLKTILLMLAVLYFQPDCASAQSIVKCGVPEQTAAEVQTVTNQINQYLSLGKSAVKSTVVIPVSVHIVRNDNGTGDISDAKVQEQIDVLNQGYIDTYYRFSLYSIDRTNNSAWTNHTQGTSNESNMKNSLSVNTVNVMNLYFCVDPKASNGSSLLGYATFPWSYPEANKMHGIVIKSSTVPGGIEPKYNEGKTATHEAGHYLGLYHTFQGGCSGTGDEVSDTPAEASPAYDCQEGRNTCSSPGNDPIHNFMDYSDDPCLTEFTSGQSTRIDLVVPTYKPGLSTQKTIVITQVNSSGSPVGTVARWNNTDFQNVALGSRHSIVLGKTEVLKGEQSVLSNEKYTVWKKGTDAVQNVKNHHEFFMDQEVGEVTYTSQLINVTSASLKVKLDDIDFPTGTVKFRDPWLIDYIDPVYGYYERNRGMTEAIFKPVVSSNNNLGIGTPYKGVFKGLDPNFGSSSYYKIKSENTETFGTQEAYFQNWWPDGASLSNWSSGSEQPVVFTSNNAVITGNFKGHLRSNSAGNSIVTNQRRVVKDGNTWLMVYESMNKIWMTLSLDNGVTWSKDEFIGQSNGMSYGYGINPTISNVVKNSPTDPARVVVGWTEVDATDPAASGLLVFATLTMNLTANGSIQKGWAPVIPTDYYPSFVRKIQMQPPTPTPYGSKDTRVSVVAKPNGEITFAYNISPNFQYWANGLALGHLNASTSSDIRDCILGLPSDIASGKTTSYPVLIYYPAAYGQPELEKLYYVSTGYASGTRIVEYNLKTSTSALLPLPLNDYSYLSLSGAVNATSASYTLTANAINNYLVNTNIYQKGTYLGNSQPTLDKVYTNAENSVLMVQNTSNYGAPIYEVNFKQGTSWYKATGGASITQIGSNVGGIFAREQVGANDRKSVFVKTNTSPASLVVYSGSGVLNKGESVLYADVRSVRNYVTLSGQSKTAILDFAGALVEPVDSLENGAAICAVKLIAPDQNTIIVRQPDSIKTALAIDLIRNGVSVRSYSASLWDELSINSFEDVQDGDVLVFRLGFPVASSWGYEIYDFNGTSLTKNEEETADAVKLKKLENGVSVYPNPFNPNTSISVSLEAPASVKVMVFNILGQLVSDFGKADLGAGVHTYAFDGKTLASGTYFYRVEIGEKVKTGKLQLLK